MPKEVLFNLIDHTKQHSIVHQPKSIASKTLVSINGISINSTVLDHTLIVLDHTLIVLDHTLIVIRSYINSIRSYINSIRSSSQAKH